MRSRTTALLLFSLGALCACGAATTPDGAARTDASADSSQLPDTSVLPDVLPPSDGPPPTVTADNLSAFGGCMPQVPADPIGASWTLRVQNARGSVATVRGALLSLSGSTMSYTQSIAVTPTTIPLAGGSGTEMMRKTGGDTPPQAVCGAFCGGTTAVLALTVEVDGQQLTARATAPYQCAF